MELRQKNGCGFLELSGRIDSTNAETIGAEIDAVLQREDSVQSLLFDAGALEYISSAGLRILLRLRKRYASMKIINVSSEVYDIFEMTGFTEMFPIEKAFRELSVEGCPIIGQGARGTVYRYDGDTIVKVYKNPDSLQEIQSERRLARRAFVLGIPTAISYDIVRVGKSYGSVFELLESKSYTQLFREDPANMDLYLDEYAALLRKLHATMVSPEDMPDIKIFVRDWVETAAPYLENADADTVRRLIDAVPDTMNMLHCDFHTNNVLRQNGETLLIDMDTLSHGHPVFELANIYITHVGFGEIDPAMVESFLGLPYALSKSIWEQLLPRYLQSNDPARIAEVETKVRVIATVRLLRHFLRYFGADSDIGKRAIPYCRDLLHDLLSQTDTLDFS